MSTYSISHPTLGHISVVERPDSSKLSARWVNGELRVNIPAGLSRSQIAETIEKHRADFEHIRPRPRFTANTRLRFDGGVSVFITVGNASVDESSASTVKTANNIVRLRPASPEAGLSFIIETPPFHPVESPEVQKHIDSCLRAVARHLAPKILIPRARKISQRFGLRVDTWEISHGKTTLGLCFPAERRIKLSYMCVFLTDELRDYIICHELAHLTEPGHTPEFHALCNLYCRGREPHLRALLRNYHWPVDR